MSWSLFTVKPLVSYFFFSCIAARAFPRVHVNFLSRCLLLNDERHPCFPCGSGSPLKVATSPSGLRGSNVHAHGHVLPGLSGATPGTHSVKHLLEHLHTLLFLAAWSHWVALELSATLRPPAVGHALFFPAVGTAIFPRVLGSRPLASYFMGPWVPPPGCFFSSRPFGTCFIQHSAHLLDGHRLTPHNPCNQLNSGVTVFGNTQASGGDGNHHLPRTSRCPPLCRRGLRPFPCVKGSYLRLNFKGPESMRDGMVCHLPIKLREQHS